MYYNIKKVAAIGFEPTTEKVKRDAGLFRCKITYVDRGLVLFGF